MIASLLFVIGSNSRWAIWCCPLESANTLHVVPMYSQSVNVHFPLVIARTTKLICQSSDASNNSELYPECMAFNWSMPRLHFVGVFLRGGLADIGL